MMAMARPKTRIMLMENKSRDEAPRFGLLTFEHQAGFGCFEKVEKPDCDAQFNDRDLKS